jgi:hypothetical protein
MQLWKSGLRAIRVILLPPAWRRALPFWEPHIILTTRLLLMNDNAANDSLNYNHDFLNIIPFLPVPDYS